MSALRNKALAKKNVVLVDLLNRYIGARAANIASSEVANKKLTIEEKRALLNAIKQNGLSTEQKMRIKAIRGLPNFPQMTTIEEVDEYYRKLLENRNYAEILERAKSYGGLTGSLDNLEGVVLAQDPKKQNKRLLELIKRFKAVNGGGAAILAQTNATAKFDLLQQVIAELQKKGKPMKRDELEKLLGAYKVPQTVVDKILAELSSNSPALDDIIAAIETVRATTTSLNAGAGSNKVPVSPNLENLARRWNAYKKRTNQTKFNTKLLEELEALSNNNKSRIDKILEKMIAPSSNAGAGSNNKNLKEALLFFGYINASQVTKNNLGKRFNARKVDPRVNQTVLVNHYDRLFKLVLPTNWQAKTNIERLAITYKEKRNEARALNGTQSFKNRIAQINSQLGNKPTPTLYTKALQDLESIILNLKYKKALIIINI
jgi:hypothetical protein